MAAPCSSGFLSRSARSWFSTAATGSLPADDPGTLVTARATRYRPGPASPLQDGSRDAGPAILDAVDPIDRLRLAGKRMTDPLESLAQRVAERVIDLVVDVLDLNALVQSIDLNAVLGRIDMNDLVQRLDIDALVEQTDLGAVIAKSSGGMATDALDAARSQAVGLDGFIDRWVQRALRRKQ